MLTNRHEQQTLESLYGKVVITESNWSDHPWESAWLHPRRDDWDSERECMEEERIKDWNNCIENIIEADFDPEEVQYYLEKFRKEWIPPLDTACDWNDNWYKCCYEKLIRMQPDVLRSILPQCTL